MRWNAASKHQWRHQQRQDQLRVQVNLRRLLRGEEQPDNHQRDGVGMRSRRTAIATSDAISSKLDDQRLGGDEAFHVSFPVVGFDTNPRSG